MTTPSGFDPENPLGRRTLYDILATGAGRAHPTRLAIGAVCGVGGALAISLWLPRWWAVAMPLLCIASFCVSGLAAQKLDDLDLGHTEGQGLRGILRVTKVAALVMAALAGLIAVGSFVLAALGPAWGR